MAAKTALAQEKVWFDKPSYDKAACLHFERLTKVVAEKILEQRQFEASLKKLTKNSPPLAHEANACSNEQTVNSSKKSKDKNSKATKKHRNVKKSKSDTVDPKEQITPIHQEAQQSVSPVITASGSLVNEIAKARQHLKKSLQCMNGIVACSAMPVTLQDVVSRCAAIEKDNQELRNSVEELKEIVKQLEIEVNAKYHPIAVCPAKPQEEVAHSPATKATDVDDDDDDDDDDDVDFFGSDSEGEDAEAAKIREERLAAYAAKKSKKPVLIAKSNIILDVKPWDDETDMKVLESEVRKIECDGLLWGAAKLVPLAYGIHKLQISCVVEDEKVSVDWLTEAIQEIEEYVQSVDIAAFNKV